MRISRTTIRILLFASPYLFPYRLAFYLFNVSTSQLYYHHKLSRLVSILAYAALAMLDRPLMLLGHASFYALLSAYIFVLDTFRFALCL
ncbi:hypothetical protein RSAG8_02402, partial [Rhizoctonia solani AG-8 WAC10335]